MNRPVKGIAFNTLSPAATISAMKKIMLYCLLLAVSFVPAACADVSLGQIELPDGFEISIYAEGVDNARQMADELQKEIDADEER